MIPREYTWKALMRSRKALMEIDFAIAKANSTPTYWEVVPCVLYSSELTTSLGLSRIDKLIQCVLIEKIHGHSYNDSNLLIKDQHVVILEKKQKVSPRFNTFSCPNKLGVLMHTSLWLDSNAFTLKLVATFFGARNFGGRLIAQPRLHPTSRFLSLICLG